MLHKFFYDIEENLYINWHCN